MKITTILKRDGREQKYSRRKIVMATWQSLWAVDQVRKKSPALIDIDEIARRAAEIEVPHSMADAKSILWKQAEILTRGVEKSLLNFAKPHQWSVEEIQDIREQTLMAAGREAEAKAYIFYRNKKQGARQKLVYLGGQTKNKEENLGMGDNALAAMAKRYLWKDKEGNVIETPKEAMERVAEAVAAVEDGPLPRQRTVLSKKRRDKFLEIMTSFEFVPGGCYFRGAGNKQNGSLANCFVLPVEDSIEKIFDAVKWAALIHQMGGGTGFNFSHLRPRGDMVRSGGLSSGPINFMKAFDAETQIVMQGGVHRGANMGILNVDHPDIFEFIRAKSVDGEISNFNISVGAFDGFMRAVKDGKDWALINPRDKTAVQKIPARGLWDEMVNLAHSTGDPGMIYLDAVNRFNPVLKTLGPIESTNVCGEQPLHPFDVCNLGSINLSKFVIKPWWEKNNTEFKIPNTEWKRREDASDIQHSVFSIQYYSQKINWSRLEEVVRTAVRFLDDGIDASAYPIPQITDMAHRLRRIGLGVMGWADMLVKLGVKYDSDEGIKLAESIMKFIQEISWDESERLSKEKAEFPLWEQSYFNSVKNPFGKRRKVRNVAVTTIAPTGTISMIADCSSGIEPYFALEYTKNVVEKKGLKYTNKYYEEAKNKMAEMAKTVKMAKNSNHSDHFNHLNNIFRTSHEISPDWHVKMQAAFQKYTDNAVSKTINFPGSATVFDIENAYMLAWELGCKGITVYRDGSREGQVLQIQNTEYRILNKKQKNQRPRIQNSEFRIQNSQKLAQSQMKITPLSQRAYQVERRKITEDLADGHCPECGAAMTSESGCSTCYSCGYSKCSL